MPSVRDSVREDIRGFIATRFPDVSLDDGEDIFASGYVNSLFAMELVLHVEKLAGTAVPNDELDLRHFRTVDAMVALIDRLTVTSARV